MQHKLSAEIDSVSNSEDIQLMDSRKRTWEIYENLVGTVNDLNLPVKLVVVGSLVTQLNASKSSLNIFMKIPESNVKNDIFEIVYKTLNEKYGKRTNNDDEGNDNRKFIRKFFRFTYQGSSIEVRMLSMQDCLKETASNVAILTTTNGLYKYYKY